MQLNSDSSLNQIRQDLFLEGHEILAHVRVGHRSERETEHNAFTAFDQETHALVIVICFADSGYAHK